MAAARLGHTATQLADGRVLMVAGYDGTAALASAEIFDPKTGTFTTTGSLPTAAVFHTATLLSDGRGLVAGGTTDMGVTAFVSAQIYDPKTGIFTATG